MNTPQIQIDQRFAKINITIRNPAIEVNQDNSKLSINYPEDKIEINQHNARVYIDSYPSRYDLNIKKIGDMRKDITQKSKQIWIQAVSRMSQNGDRLMRIETNQNAVVQIAAQEAFPPRRELVYKWVSRPENHVTPGKLEIKFNQKSLDISSGTGNTDIFLNKGDVNISMSQYNELNISVRGNWIDTLI
ncbi:MAG: DUF6470 family protein [Halanaerobiales bacterium]